jgi:hemerythrin-like domain-containing protein
MARLAPMPHPIMQQLHEDHGNFRRLVDLLQRQLDASEPAQGADLDIIRGSLHYMVNYADYFHHPLEDLVFERLLGHDNAVQPTIELLEREHDVLPVLGRDLARDFNRDADAVARDWFVMAQRAGDYAEQLAAHKDREEAVVFPLVKVVLTDADFRAVEAAINWQEDPLFGRHTSEGYRMLLERLTNG